MKKAFEELFTIKWLLAVIIGAVIIYPLNVAMSRWIAPIFVSLFKNISSGLNDFLYELASSGVHEQASLSSYSSIQLLFCILMFSSCFLGWYSNRYQYRALKKIESAINSETSNLAEIDLCKEEPVNSFSSLKKRYYISLAGFIVVILCITFLLVCSMFTVVATDIATNTLYNIEIVAPYIQDVEYKTLISDFYQMNSEKDYDSIMKTISSIADANGLTLKK